MSTRKYWLGFNHVAGVGPLRMAALRRHFSSLEDAWLATDRDLRQAGLDSRAIKNLQEARNSLDLDSLQHQLDELGASALTLDDLDYPSVLKELPDAPPVLYMRGTLTTEDEWSVAIVGTRKASAYGRDMAYQLARDLAHEGITVVSGLALGIDAAAHKGALDAGGRTIAALPCGIDRTYPPAHRTLARTIAEHGALVTEFPPGTNAVAKNFPPRNRIISGLSLAVIVVEAPLKSGALITADFAAEQGRDVFAVPGQSTTPSSRGSNTLIQEGAKLIMGVDDVLSELNLTRSVVESRTEARKIAPENAEEALILQYLSDGPQHIDDLCRSCELPTALVSSTLTLMELKGLVRQIGGMQYTLAVGSGAPYVLD